MPVTITHAFVNGKADGADATVTRPSDWNANHTITGALASGDSPLSGDVALNNTATWFDGPSVSLTVGTWLVTGHACVEAGSATTMQCEARLYDGTTVYDHSVNTISTANGFRSTSPLMCVVTIAGSATMKLQAKSDQTTSILKRDPGGPGFNLATRISAVKITVA